MGLDRRHDPTSLGIVESCSLVPGRFPCKRVELDGALLHIAGVKDGHSCLSGVLQQRAGDPYRGPRPGSTTGRPPVLLVENGLIGSDVVVLTVDDHQHRRVPQATRLPITGVLDHLAVCGQQQVIPDLGHRHG